MNSVFLHVVMWCDGNGVFHSRERIKVKPLPDSARGQLLTAPKTHDEVVTDVFEGYGK